MEKVRVLIADDHELVRCGLQAVFELVDDFEVVGMARDGQETIDKAKKCPPDVVLMDLRMPQVDGIAASREIKTFAPQTNVLILSAFDDEHEIREAIAAGASGYVLKDIAPEALIDAVRVVNGGQSLLQPAVARKIISGSCTDVEKKIVPKLTRREMEVLKLMTRGFSNKEIADALFVGIKTIKTHVSHVLQKLGLSSRTQAVLYAIQNDLARVTDD
ncbi:MAG: response regulator transcription factor [Actinomycetota bacterium]|nr:response regulator transcription factor [Actinomycetota bacterium]